MLGFLQRIGKALMLPIAVLPAAALLLRLGKEDMLDIPFMEASGNAIMAQLPLIFAIGVAIGLAKDSNGAAALAGAIGYFVLVGGTQAIDKHNDMAVFAGLIAGTVAGLLYNRYHNIQLPQWLGFFGGKRFVPIITAGSMLVLAGIFGYVWPPIQSFIDGIGQYLIDLGALGAGIFGVLNRLLIPVGLHHILNNIVWFLFGEYNGERGDIARFFAGDPTAGTFMTGFFPIMMFGLPAAALAMIAAAKKERRKLVTGMLVSLALTSFLTGVTEPIEFLFMFLAPVLYVVHALLTGLSMYITVSLDIHDGFGFSAGAIDYLLNYNIAQKPLLLLGVGVIYGILYFIIFYAVIKKFDLKTPGREDEVVEEVQHNGEEKYEKAAEQYIAGLGGVSNIEELDNCVTRLRLKMKDTSLIQEEVLKKAGAKGVIKLNERDVQVVIGTDVEFVANEIRRKRE